MDQIKTGALIKQLRINSGLTQKQLADSLCVSDKAVSKWECGNGCPDVSLLTALAEVLDTDIQALLSGSIEKNESEKGDMKKLRFYVCRDCGNIITATSDAAVTCCGSRLSPIEAKKADESHQLKDITSDHPMTKEHYISFAAYVSDSSVMMFRQYPEWQVNITIPMYRSGKLVWYCNECGLLCQELRPKR